MKPPREDREEPEEFQERDTQDLSLYWWEQ